MVKVSQMLELIYTNYGSFRIKVSFNYFQQHNGISFI